MSERTCGACATCRWWGAVGRTKPPDVYRRMFVGVLWTGDDADVRVCALTYRYEWAGPDGGEGHADTLAFAVADAGDTSYALATAADFGCVQWAAKEEDG